MDFAITMDDAITMDEGVKNTALLSAVAQHTERYGSNHWFRLGLDLENRHAPVEPMHTINIFAEHMVKLLNGDEDGPKVRAAERANGRFTESCTDTIFTAYAKEKKTVNQKKSSDQAINAVPKKLPKGHLPDAPFTLTAEQKVLADRRLSNVKVPASFNVPDTLFKKITGGINSHSWMQTYKFHLLHHLPHFVKLYGPPANFWMFPYERFNHTLTTSVSSHSHPEVSSIKKIEVQWLLAMLEAANIEPSKTNCKEEDGGGQGTYKVVTRPLVLLLKTSILIMYIYHYACVSDTIIKDSTIEEPKHRQSTSVVFSGNDVCRVAYFAKIIYMNSSCAVAFMVNYGVPQICNNSQCYMIPKKDGFSVDKVAFIGDIKPTIHLAEGNFLWLPKKC